MLQNYQQQFPSDVPEHVFMELGIYLPMIIAQLKVMQFSPFMRGFFNAFNEVKF